VLRKEKALALKDDYSSKLLRNKNNPVDNFLAHDIFFCQEKNNR